MTPEFDLRPGMRIHVRGIGRSIVLKVDWPAMPGYVLVEHGSLRQWVRPSRVEPLIPTIEAAR